MRRAPAVAPAAAALAAAALSCAPSAVATVPDQPPDPFQCASDNRWCVGAFVRDHRRFLDVFGFHMKGRYQVCVTPPRGREGCKSFTLVRNASGAHASSIRFTHHFPHARRGTYAVRWVYDGKQVGPVLRFKHPA